MPKVKVKNRAKGPRGFVVQGKLTMIEPGAEAEVELDEHTAELTRVSSEAGGDIEVLSSAQGSLPRAQMKRG